MTPTPDPALARRGPLRLAAVLALATGLPGASRLPGGDWPQWRGPDGTSVSRETGLPTAWSEQEGVAWRCQLPGWGNSTPAIWGDGIFVTSQDGEALLLLRISKRSGAVEWTREVGRGKADTLSTISKHGNQRLSQNFHPTQNLASPSPVTDGERVIVHFGNGLLASYTFGGDPEWRRNLQDDHGMYTIWWGHANSPVLFEDLVISVCMQDSLTDLQEKPSPSYVVAHDKRTGREVWKTMRMTGATSEPCDSYTTPLFRQTPDGPEMIVVGGTWVDAYAPRTGKQIWCLTDLGGNRTITGPTLAGDTLFFTVGMRGPVTALRLGKRGKLSPQDIAWRFEQATPDSPSPVWADGLLFFVNDGGFATCLDAATGERRWKEKLPGDHRASPLAAEGRIWFLSTSGRATVIEAASSFKVVGEGKVEDTMFASPAVSDGRLFLRGYAALWCIGKKR